MPPKIKRIDKRLYLGLFLSPIVVGVIVLILVFIGSEIREVENLLEDMAAPCAIVYSVLFFSYSILFHYRMWAAIYDRHMDTSPVMAVVGLIVPIYNIYWIFKFYPGFAEYYNGNIQRYGLISKVQPIDDSMFRTYPVLILVSILLSIISVLIPPLSLLVRLVNIAAFIIFLIIVSRTCDAVNAFMDESEKKSISISREIKRIRKKIFLGAILLPIVCSFILLLGMIPMPVEDISKISDVMFENNVFPVVCIVLLIPYIVLAIIVHYRMWDAVYNKYVYMSSDFAVLLLCIPIVNIFWAFWFYRDFVRFYNEEVNFYISESRLKPIGGLLYYAFLVFVVFCAVIIIVTIFNWDIYIWLKDFHISHDTREILWDIRSALKHKAPMILISGILLIFTMLLAVIWQASNAVNNLADAVERNYRRNRKMGRLESTSEHSLDMVKDDFNRDRGVKHPVKATKGSRILIIPRGDKKS